MASRSSEQEKPPPEKRVTKIYFIHTKLEGGSECKGLEPPDKNPSIRPESPPSSPILSSPWRVSRPLNLEKLTMLKMRVENYSLPSYLKATQARILMLGPVGAGKSSFFNTINSIFQGRITQQSLAGNATSSLTMMYRQYQVRSLTPGKTLNFRLCDTRGVGEETPDLADLNYLLEGNIPDGYMFSSTSIGSDIKGFIHKPELQDKVHCVVFLFDANSVKATKKDIWDKFSQLRDRMNRKGIPRVIVLTKIDQLLQTADIDVSSVFYSNGVKKVVQYASEKLRVPLGDVMPIANYANYDDLHDEISCLALQALDRMLGYANDYLVNQHDLMKLL